MTEAPGDREGTAEKDRETAEKVAGLRTKPDLYFRSVAGGMRQAPQSRRDRSAITNMVGRILDRVRHSIDERTAAPASKP